MQITIFSGFSKEHNSTKQPTGGTAVSCYLKDDTSLINPVFILDGADFTTNYVQWGNRYYFVDDVVSIRNSAVELHCSVDALASWKTQIGSSMQYVTRSSASYNPKVIDTYYPAENDCTVQQVYLSDLHSALHTGGCFVVGVANGGNTASGGVTYYALSNAEFTSFMSYMFGGNWLDAPLTEVSNELQKELVNPFQYVVSAMWYPFNIGGTGALIKFGYWDSDTTGNVISASVRNQITSTSISIPRHPQAATRGRFLNGNPYTQLMLNIYMFGNIPIDASYFVNSDTCAVSINIDLYTGIGLLRVTDPSGYNICERSTQCGVPIQISQVNANLMGAGLSAIATGVSFAAGNALGVASGILSSINSLMPQIESKGAVGSSVAWSPIPTLIATHRNLVTEDNEHIGRPLMRRSTISSLSGYIQVENPDVDIPGTTQEKDTIMSYLQSGFYYE